MSDAPPPNEQSTVLAVFAEMLRAATGDGGRKRAAGLKPPWWRDLSHEAAIFSHLNKWKHGERVDRDSGAHPLVHLAWRALAIAYQETHGKTDPAREVCVYCHGSLGDMYFGTGQRFVCAPCYLSRRG